MNFSCLRHKFAVRVGLMVLYAILFSTTLAANPAQAAREPGFSLPLECANMLNSVVKSDFHSQSEEISYMSRYLSCWGENNVINAKTPRYAYFGKGLELFSHPEYIEAISFSKYMCAATQMRPGFIRNDYPCWLERESIAQGTSLEDAARRESPKVLFSSLMKTRNGEDMVEYVMCPNDDPTKPKEYTRGCSRGKKIEITEYGRGDMNGDGVEDMVVNIKFGESKSQSRWCYMGIYTRKDGDLIKMISFSPLGLCQ